MGHLRLDSNSTHGASLPRRVLQGTALALFLTAFQILFGSKGKDLSSAQLSVLSAGVALGGGVGGAVYFALDGLRARGGWRRIGANALSLLAYAAATVAFLALGARWVIPD